MFTKSSPRTSSRSAFQSSSKEKIERGWIRRSTSCRVCGNSYKLIVEGLRIRVLEKERPRMLSPVVSVCWGLRRKTAGSILNNNLLGDNIFWWLFCVCHIKARVDNRKKNSYRKVWVVMNGEEVHAADSLIWVCPATTCDLETGQEKAAGLQRELGGSCGAFLQNYFSELLCGGWILRGRWLAMFILIFYFMMLFMLLLFMVNC